MKLDKDKFLEILSDFEAGNNLDKDNPFDISI